MCKTLSPILHCLTRDKRRLVFLLNSPSKNKKGNRCHQSGVNHTGASQNKYMVDFKQTSIGRGWRSLIICKWNAITHDPLGARSRSRLLKCRLVLVQDDSMNNTADKKYWSHPKGSNQLLQLILSVDSLPTIGSYLM